MAVGTGCCDFPIIGFLGHEKQLLLPPACLPVPRLGLSKHERLRRAGVNIIGLLDLMTKTLSSEHYPTTFLPPQF